MDKTYFLHNLLNKMSRAIEILPEHVGNTFLVHNGKDYVKLSIIKEMIYFKFGEFIKTRNINGTKVLKKKSQKKKRK